MPLMILGETRAFPRLWRPERMGLRLRVFPNSFDEAAVLAVPDHKTLQGNALKGEEG